LTLQVYVSSARTSSPGYGSSSHYESDGVEDKVTGANHVSASPVPALNFECFDPDRSFWSARVFSKYLDHVHISRLLGQGQSQTGAKPCDCIRCSRMASLRLSLLMLYSWPPGVLCRWTNRLEFASRRAEI